MRLFSELATRLRSLVFAGREDSELDEEMRFHIEREIEKNLAAGMSPREALRQAHIKFGGVERMRERTREARGVGVVEDLARDVGLALRRLRRDGAFTAGVALLLGLGIGANVGVFSIVNGVLLRPLPYHDSERLVSIREVIPQLLEGSLPVNERHYLEWRTCGCVEDIALSSNYNEVNLTGGEVPERVPRSSVTTNTFDLLGVQAQLGRTFVAEDGRAGEDQVVLISDELWRRRLGGDPAVVGSTIELNGSQATVVGVLPPGFRHFDRTRAAPDGRVDVYSPWTVSPADGVSWFGNFNFSALARLKEGVSLSAARQELDGIQTAIAENFGAQAGASELRAEVTPLRESLTGQSRGGLLLLLVAVGVALLVACFNVANLMLVRASAGRGGAALRTALGASRVAIFRGALVESALLGLAGCILGVALAAVVLQGFGSFAPPGLPRAEEVGLDWTVMLIGIASAMLATLVFGLAPALRMSRVDPQSVLRADARGIASSGGWVRQGLIPLEVGLSAALLVVAGLLAVSFARLQAVDRGYDANNVLTAELTLPTGTYGPASRAGSNNAHERFWIQLIERLESQSGVTAVGVTSMLPLRGDSWGDAAIPVGVEDFQQDGIPGMEYRWVSPDYWAAMGIPFLGGRPFEAPDRPGQVAVVSSRVASALWPDEDPIGKRFSRGDPDVLYEVVGVVPDVHAVDLADEPVPLLYLPIWLQGAPMAAVAIRTTGDPATATALLREVVASLDPQLAVSDVQTMETIDRDVLAERRFGLTLVAAFAIASLLIAAIGTYSVLAYTVTGRMHEIAIRLSLGAEPARIRAMVVGQGMRSVLLGLTLGMGAALMLGRSLTTVLYSVSPSEPAPFVLVALVTLITAAAACWIPARRAAAASSLTVLRGE